MKTSRPVHQVRLGLVAAAIWENETPRGSRHNVTFSKLYKGESDSDWSRTQSFSRDDLPVVEKVAALAYAWIHDQGKSRVESAG